MKKLDIKKIWMGLAAASILCAMPTLSVYGQGKNQESKLVRKQDEVTKKWGFADSLGNVIIPCTYSNVGRFTDGLAPVVKGGELDFIDLFAFPGLNNAADIVNFKEGKLGFIDETGKEIIPCIYEATKGFIDSMAIVRQNRKWGFLDKSGKEIIPFKYDDVVFVTTLDSNRLKTNLFFNGLASVWREGKWGCVDQKGVEIIPCKYDDSVIFREYGLAEVKSLGKCGLIDKTDKLIIPCKYTKVKGYSDGLAAVKSGKKWGYIDEAWNQVIPFKYDEAEDFKNGVAEVRLRGKTVKIDKTGKEVK